MVKVVWKIGVAEGNDKIKSEVNQMSTIYKLAYVLCHIDDFKWSDALFLPQNEVWNLQSSCVVLDPDDVLLDPDDFYISNNEMCTHTAEDKFVYSLDIQTIQLICKNAYDQKPNCTVEDLLNAFLYFYDHDAYLEF